MGMQLPGRIFDIRSVFACLRPGRRAVPAHRIGERGLEQVVVPGKQLFQYLCQSVPLRPGQVRQPQHVAARQE